jgi:hypothetical protein
MVIWLIRVAFILVIFGVGFAAIRDEQAPLGDSTWLLLAASLTIGVLVMVGDYVAPRRKLSIFAGAFFGLLVGIVLAYALSFVTQALVLQFIAPRIDSIQRASQVEALTRYVNLLIGTITVDVILLMAGISPNIMLWVGPFTTFHSAFVHANLNWTLGPFKYVIATPVFHRWHHTAVEEGGDTNFAGTFPLWDILFGTFRMPDNVLPEAYGADDKAIPSELPGQLAYPFRQ